MSKVPRTPFVESFDVISRFHEYARISWRRSPAFNVLAKFDANPKTAGARCGLALSDWLFQRRPKIFVFQAYKQKKAFHTFSPALVDGVTTAPLDKAHRTGLYLGSELPYRRDASSRGVALQWYIWREPQGATNSEAKGYAKSTWWKKGYNTFKVDI